MQTLEIGKLGFSQCYYTFTLTLLIKIVPYSKFPWTTFINYVLRDEIAFLPRRPYLILGARECDHVPPVLRVGPSQAWNSSHFSAGRFEFESLARRWFGLSVGISGTFLRNIQVRGGRGGEVGVELLVGAAVVDVQLPVQPRRGHVAALQEEFRV